jgi:hypothetical protein
MAAERPQGSASRQTWCSTPRGGKGGAKRLGSLLNPPAPLVSRGRPSPSTSKHTASLRARKVLVLYCENAGRHVKHKLASAKYDAPVRLRGQRALRKDDRILHVLVRLRGQGPKKRRSGAASRGGAS